MKVWPNLGVVYQIADSGQWDADIALFNQFGITNIRAASSTMAQYMCDAGFWVDWGPNTTSQLTASNWQAYHDHVMTDIGTWMTTGRQLGTIEIGNELENLIDGTTLTLQQLNVNLRQLALDVKAAHPSVGSVSYHCWNKSLNGTTVYADWIANGLGGIDLIGIHPYGYAGSVLIEDSGYTYIQQMMQAFGKKCYVSEFNIDSSSTNMGNITIGSAVEDIRHFYEGYILRYIAPYNSKAFLFNWRSDDNSNFSFIDPVTGSMRQYWYPIINRQHISRSLV